jgi:hypothetical protein
MSVVDAGLGILLQPSSSMRCIQEVWFRNVFRQEFCQNFGSLAAPVLPNVSLLKFT